MGAITGQHGPPRCAFEGWSANGAALEVEIDSILRGSAGTVGAPLLEGETTEVDRAASDGGEATALERGLSAMHGRALGGEMVEAM